MDTGSGLAHVGDAILAFVFTQDYLLVAYTGAVVLHTLWVLSDYLRRRRARPDATQQQTVQATAAQWAQGTDMGDREPGWAAKACEILLYEHWSSSPVEFERRVWLAAKQCRKWRRVWRAAQATENGQFRDPLTFMQALRDREIGPYRYASAAELREIPLARRYPRSTTRLLPPH